MEKINNIPNFSENIGFLEKIISDSILIDMIEPDILLDSIDNLSGLIKSLLPLVKNFDLVTRFYSGNYDFTNDELLELSEYLQYMGSKKILEVLVIMKCTEEHEDIFRNKINKYLIKDYDNILLSFNDYIEISNILLKVSIYYNLVELVKYLIDKPTDEIGKFDINNSMIFASKCGHLRIVELLLERGANIHCYNGDALQYASGNGHKDIVELLINRGADIHNNRNSALRNASTNGHTDVVKLLLERGANIHADNNYSLRMASRNGYKETVELLLNNINRNDNYGCNQALSISCELGHLYIVKLALNKGADIHTGYDIALRNASSNGHRDIVELLLERGAHIHTFVDLPLRSACQNGHLHVVELLLERGADIYTIGNLPLRLASQNGHTDVVQLLLDRGADIHACDNLPLRLASQNGHKDVVQLLLSRGADIHAGNDAALKRAYQNKNQEIIDLLLSKGAKL